MRFSEGGSKEIHGNGGINIAAGYIEAAQIPRTEGNVMAMMLFDTISDYFLDPLHKKEFEDWKAKKDKPQIRRVK